ncbi:MAG TPA: maleylpyruvate isomerase N-terminal domain-containing protein [Acidimicrobiales bacterium]
MEGPGFDAFRAAATYFVDVVASVSSSSWDAPGLGVWTVLETVGHASRANVIIIDYLEHPQPPEAPDSTYWSEANIAERGRKAVATLGDDPHATVAAAADFAVAFIGRTPADATVGSPIGTMTLSDYLPSRTAELTIHGLDIARALNLDLAPPTEALLESLAFVATISSTRKHQGVAVLLALTGRADLPPGFSAY